MNELLLCVTNVAESATYKQRKTKTLNKNVINAQKTETNKNKKNKVKSKNAPLSPDKQSGTRRPALSPTSVYKITRHTPRTSTPHPSPLPEPQEFLSYDPKSSPASCAFTPPSRIATSVNELQLDPYNRLHRDSAIKSASANLTHCPSRSSHVR